MPRYNKDAQLIDESNIMMDVNNTDDEEIDEDEAFNSEDELMYGEFLLSKKKNKSSKKKKSGGGNLKGGSDDDDDDDDENSDGSYSISGDDEGGKNDWASAGDSSSDSENSNEEEDEEDDGGQYMLDLLNNLDKQVPSSGDKKNSSIMKKKDGQGGGGGGKISFDNNISSEAAVHLQESEYQSGALSSMSAKNDGGQGDNNGKLLTLDSLMGGIADTAGFATVQKSMRGLSSGLLTSTNNNDKSVVVKKSNNNKLETTKAPVSRIISDRASRKVHYESTSTDMTKWKDAVHEQRDAETLDFRTNKGGATTNRITRDTLIDKFEPTNDFEREIQLALEKAGMDDESKLVAKEKRRLTGVEEGEEDGDMVDEDDDDLGSNKITLAEYKKRHGELAKLRALMFYEEQKRHPINKIKSKKYRKIRKRQKDRQQNAEDEAHAASLGGAEADREEKERIEREEMERMKERMTLAHKNTSKWARRVLRRGNKMDVEERRALSLQIAKGDELRRKVMGEEEDDGGDSDEEETEEGLLKKARDILMEDDHDDDENAEGKGGKKKGLFQLEFMKKGMEAQRIRAKEEARKLLEELEANEMAAMSSSSDDDDESEDDDEGEGEQTTKRKKKRVATEAETNKILPEGKLVASSLKFGKGDGFAIKVDGNIELGGVNGDGIKVEPGNNVENEQEESSAGKGKKKKKNKKKKNQSNDVVPTDDCSNTKSASTATAATAQDEEEENPWIVPKSSSTKKSSKALSRAININEAASMLVDTVQDDKKSKRKRDDDDDIESKSNEKREQGAKTENTTQSASKEKDVGVAELSQAELVRRAFASPADLEAEEEFQKEKERMKERDDPTRKKDEEKFVSGWGSWAGAGAPPPKKPRKLPPKLRAPTSKKVDKATVQRKDDGMSTVIINERRLKKTAKFQLSEIPYPYRSREEYEKSIAGNIGQEWNTMHGTKEMSRPAILVRAGKIIQPIGKRSKQKVKRAPAKF